MKNFKSGGGGGFKQHGGGFGGGQRFGGGENRSHERSGHGKFGKGRSNDFHGGKSESGRSFSKPELFSAVCSTCGKGCEVPFRPSGDKPVYCSACFGKKSQDMNRESRGDRQESEFTRDARPQREEKSKRHEHDKTHEAFTQHFVTLEFKIDRILELLRAHAHPQALEHTASISEVVTKKVRKPKTEKIVTPVKKKVSKKVKNKK